MNFATATVAAATDYIRDRLASDDAKFGGWVINAVLAIYSYQTEDERDDLTTRYWNGVGFNGPDAHRMTRYAEEILAWQQGRETDDANPFPATGRTTRANHYAFERGRTSRPYNARNQWPLGRAKTDDAKQRIVKYAKQLAKIAIGRAQEAAEMETATA